jgi:hypothetical protein
MARVSFRHWAAERVAEVRAPAVRPEPERAAGPGLLAQAVSVAPLPIEAVTAAPAAWALKAPEAPGVLGAVNSGSAPGGARAGHSRPDCGPAGWPRHWAAKSDPRAMELQDRRSLRPRLARGRRTCGTALEAQAAQAAQAALAALAALAAAMTAMAFGPRAPVARPSCLAPRP